MALQEGFVFFSVFAVFLCEKMFVWAFSRYLNNSDLF